MTEGLSGAELLIRLRVTDAVTGAGLRGARVACSVRSGDGEFRPSPLGLRAASDGWFVMAASLNDTRARLRLGVTTRFRFKVSHTGYQPAEEVLLIAPADFGISTEEIALGDLIVTRRHITGAPFEARLALDPIPVRLAGLVVRDNDLNDPVTGAGIWLNDAAPDAQTSDAAGRFLFPALPLAQTVTVSARLGSITTVVTHLIDFARPTNSLTLSIPTNPTD